MFYARLRPGLSKGTRGTVALLRRTVGQLRKAFKKARIRVRFDGGFASPQVFDALEELGVEYVVAMGGNSVLAKFSARHMHAARVLTERLGKATALFREASYKTKSWKHERRVVFKAEVVCLAGKPARYELHGLHPQPSARPADGRGLRALPGAACSPTGNGAPSRHGRDASATLARDRRDGHRERPPDRGLHVVVSSLEGLVGQGGSTCLGPRAGD